MSSSKGFLSLYEFQLIDDAGNPTTTTNTTPQDTSTTNNAQTGQTSSTDTSTNATPAQNSPTPDNTQTGQTSSTDTSTNTTPAQNNPTPNNAQTGQTSSTDTSANTTPTQTGQTSSTGTSTNTAPTQAGQTSSTDTSTNTTPAQNNPTTNNAQTGQTSSTDTSTNTSPTQTSQSSSTDTSTADTPAPTLDDLLGQAETQSPPQQQYNSYQPQNYDQYAPFIPQSAGDDGIPWLTLIGEFLGLIIFAGSVFLCFLGYVLYKRRYQNMIEEYASDPESQIKKQELTKDEEQHLAEWNFNPPENFIAGVQVTNEKGRLGQYFKIAFTETQNDMIRTIISNHQIHQVENKENCYFEFEIEDIDVGVDIVIGLGTKESFNPAVLPGDQKNTIGFHSKGGILKINGTEVNAYTLDAQFGETIGLGYNFDTSKIYLFYNAKYLNEPQREFGSPSKQSEQKSKSPSPKKEGEKENKIDLQIDKKEYFPMIGATGKCTILLNIGGSPFSIHHKEIAKGLL